MLPTIRLSNIIVRINILAIRIYFRIECRKMLPKAKLHNFKKLLPTIRLNLKLDRINLMKVISGNIVVK